jgi:hypothetical protein
VAVVPQRIDVKRLDGSAITAPEIDATVTKLMKAAEIPGVGLTACVTKKKTCR